ncbi:DNA/RNA helicase domain-containing protein [Microbispora sp. H11081]|uniref:HelD family protein n=1 Tax=Microbispora sp. H11081 TaxID=2729107 RepID=UPI0014743126|nr:DNA/RNA helicase domain-containing protein [Microbispora sp. H11081]
MPQSSTGELAREQKYVAALYERLDVLRERTRGQLDAVLAQGASGTHQNRSERDSFAGMYAQRLARLWAVENALCFGRLDLAAESRSESGPEGGPESESAGAAEGERLYIGRIGLSDDDQHRLLIDWRAPVAQPFYRATPAAPMGVTRRRHLHTRGRKVTGVDDDLLDLDGLTDDDRASLNGEAALLAALGAKRTGRMRDIVATIQAEQDKIIRSDLNGVLVVQGGPGTGKTVVALHRAAYLLYTYRERLERRGVLILGPNPTFTRYIEQVLPSLGETDVLLSTVGELYPGLTATREDPPEAAAVKGRIEMADVIARAVRERQRMPRTPVEIRLDKFTLRLDRQTLEAARSKAGRSRRPHNQARAVFVRHLLTVLTRQAARHLGRGSLDEADFADLREELRTEEPVRVALNRLWPYLTPQQLLIGLFTDRDRMAAAGLGARERDLLLREPPRAGEKAGGSWWSAADVPLLDEAAELLGDIDEGVLRAARRAEQEREERIAYAREVLELTGLADIMDAERFADRQQAEETYLTTAERAARDRTWAFGHVIVDEAQELSEMDWRTVMRRVPSRSMTIVGDIAQTGSAAGAASWARVLDPYVAGRWREERLSVNYRTPAELMEVAGRVLELVGPDLKTPESVRETGERPWALRVASLAEAAPAVAAEVVEGGRLVVIAPARMTAEIGRIVGAAVPGAATGPGPAALDAPVAVLSVGEAKGLEFDSVIVIEPGRILSESPRGPSDLYVALTRATSRLGVVHVGDLPEALSGLERR